MKIALKKNIFDNTNFRLLKFYASLFAFFYLLFFVGRFCFFVSLIANQQKVILTELLNNTLNAIYLDTATICYLSILPTLFYFGFLISNKKILAIICKGILFVLSIIYAIVTCAEILLYREWKVKLGMQAILHLKNPSEVIKTASNKEIIMFILLVALLCTISYWLIRQFIYVNINAQTTNKLGLIFTLLFLLTASSIGLRGGLRAMPIQTSDACYSNNVIYNDIAINNLFGFGSNVANYFSKEKLNPFGGTNVLVAKKYVDSIMQKAHVPIANTQSLIDTSYKQPNIVFIVLEGISADLCKAFGGDNFMPFIDSISKQSLIFTKCFASGHVSDMGNASIFSSYPASPSAGILAIPAKSNSLVCLNQSLKKQNYTSQYFFGGNLNFGNIKQYFKNHNFNTVKDISEINTSKFNLQKLGINDADMQEIFLQNINACKQPFMNCWFTLSSHNPYDIPKQKLKLTDLENDYTNCVKFTDSSLQLFFTHAQKQSWFSNTIFIITSDHSHITHKNLSIADANYHRIPLLFYGKPLQQKWIGKKIAYPVSQLDIAYTLLESLGLQSELLHYNYGKSLINTTTHFAPYTYFSGAGLVWDSSAVCYDLRNLQIANWSMDTNAKFIQTAKNFSTTYYEDYRTR